MEEVVAGWIPISYGSMWHGVAEPMVSEREAALKIRLELIANRDE